MHPRCQKVWDLFKGDVRTIIIADDLHNATYKNGLVLDPFVGSGTTTIETVLMGVEQNRMAASRSSCVSIARLRRGDKQRIDEVLVALRKYGA